MCSSAKSSPVKLCGFGNHKSSASGSMIFLFFGSINLHKFISFDLIFFSFVRALQILSVCGPDILTIAIPLGPFPEDNAKIYLSTAKQLYKEFVAVRKNKNTNALYVASVPIAINNNTGINLFPL